MANIGPWVAALIAMVLLYGTIYVLFIAGPAFVKGIVDNERKARAAKKTQDERRKIALTALARSPQEARRRAVADLNGTDGCPECEAKRRRVGDEAEAEAREVERQRLRRKHSPVVPPNDGLTAQQRAAAIAAKCGVESTPESKVWLKAYEEAKRLPNPTP